jgi:hypothetical protein
LLSLTEYQSKASEATQEQMKAQQDATKALTNFDSQMQKFRNALINLISPALEAVGFGLSVMSEFITAVTMPFSYLGKQLDKINIDFGEFGQALKIALGTLLLYGMARGSAAIVKGGMNMGSKALGMGSNLLSGSTAAAPAAAAGKTAGTGIAGKMLGAGAAVASAKAIGILSLAVVGIGAALAGATWLMGGALEKLGTGLGKVADVDGDRLKSVGEGVKALASAMAVFGSTGGFGQIKDINIESFAKNINTTLDSLDKGKIDSYTEALNSLGDSFAKVQNNMSSTVSASGKTSADKLEELNMTMKQVLYVLEGSKRYQRDTATAVGEIT